MSLDLLVQIFGVLYRWLDNNMISHILAFAKGFEYAIIIAAAVIFLLICIGLTLKNAKKLPKSYHIEIVDIYGHETSLEGLRQLFATYDAAESYARYYREVYGDMYRFRVVGSSVAYRPDK